MIIWLALALSAPFHCATRAGGLSPSLAPRKYIQTPVRMYFFGCARNFSLPAINGCVKINSFQTGEHVKNLSNVLNNSWYEKYRPTTTSNYIFKSEQFETTVHGWVDEGVIPSILLSGVQGAGKTTLSKMLVTCMDIDDIDVLWVNGSSKTGVEFIRDVIEVFVTTCALGKFKIVQIEEADRMSPQSQDALKFIIEEYQHVARFILTCNTPSRITPALHSRLQHHTFKKYNLDTLVEHTAKILIGENVKFDLDLLYKYCAASSPDIRKIINNLQQNSIKGVLHEPTEISANNYQFKLIELMENDDWVGARELICGNVPNYELENVYAYLYTHIDTCPKFKKTENWESAIVLIASHLVKHSMVADGEINMCSLLIQLSNI